MKMAQDCGKWKIEGGKSLDLKITVTQLSPNSFQIFVFGTKYHIVF